MRLRLFNSRKSAPCTMEDLEKAFKNKKARDPNGWVNEISKNGVAGKD